MTHRKPEDLQEVADADELHARTALASRQEAMSEELKASYSTKVRYTGGRGGPQGSGTTCWGTHGARDDVASHRQSKRGTRRASLRRLQ